MIRNVRISDGGSPCSVDQQQACSACVLIHDLHLRLSALEAAHHRLVWKVAEATKWEPQGCDDQPVGIAESFCQNCRTCHYPLSGCPGDGGPTGPEPNGADGPVGMPGPRGPNADGAPRETEEEHRQRLS